MPKKAKHAIQYLRVTIEYVDGASSGNRVFKDRAKAEKWAARHEKSPVVKKTTVEAFVRGRNDWVGRRAKQKDQL